MAYQTTVRPAESLFEWRAMDGLPCGCVAVAYEARGLGFLLVTIEAKGPLCSTADHQMGRTLTVGDAADLEAGGGRGKTQPEPEAPAAILPT